jgi:hypothetical protein
MIDKKVTEQLEAEDIIIGLRPTILKGGQWSGDISVSILAGRTNPLEDEDYYSFLHFAKMVAATVPVMEKSEELREIVHNYVLTEVDNIEEKEEEKGKILDITDNVVTLSFGSKTTGQA